MSRKYEPSCHPLRDDKAGGRDEPNGFARHRRIAIRRQSVRSSSDLLIGLTVKDFTERLPSQMFDRLFGE
jgi:hypothetical protein